MGLSRFAPSTLSTYNTIYEGRTQEEIFVNERMDKDLDPMGVKVREARDSEANPESMPIIIGVDVTGSMGFLADQIVRTGLGELFKSLLDGGIVADPALMTMAIGDVECDSAPLQVGQFESDLVATTWLEKIFIEGGGGGNRHESYDLPYYFAAYHTVTDAYEKRGKKGFLFTVGDEPAPRVTEVRGLRRFINKDADGVQQDIPFRDVIAAAEEKYHCFHIMIAEGYHATRRPDDVKNTWRKVMGENAIWLEDHTQLAKVISDKIAEYKDSVEDINSVLDTLKTGIA